MREAGPNGETRAPLNPEQRRTQNEREFS
jgi:hypothetical protein